ncbi:hypothetical protein AVO42_02975 [Thiomicrospira sp. XS5]|uniref:hypothetical protein n=1 Tax=Thiomicrospira sp. XS5 TaxID=1775636 RepID=UPI0007473434|nr:hypothetical protein [Thiomicrospira sp. XS5]KUJ74388.1 hypothetical protein AVO42_02975 [Thiomicrospira sp. XS5]
MILEAEIIKNQANSSITESRKKQLGQYFTPAPIAQFMAPLFQNNHESVRILVAIQAIHLAVLHQFGKLLTYKSVSEKLVDFIESQVVQTIDHPDCSNRFFESQEVSMRHQIISCAWWLLQDWPKNLYLAWLNGSVRYNQLLKDFDNSPEWYSEMIKMLKVDYRKRLTRRNNHY